MKVLAVGKHVLLEKPSSNSAEETKNMYEVAESKGLILLEAFHYRYGEIGNRVTGHSWNLFRFHPAIQRVKAIIDSEELGAIKHIEARLAVPAGIMKAGDIRYNYDLGGGGLMDMGCMRLFSLESD
jgi:predicted dehydrogenase